MSEKVAAFFVDLLERVLPVIIWQVLVERIRKAEAARIEAEFKLRLAEAHEENREKINSMDALALLNHVLSGGGSAKAQSPDTGNLPPQG